MKVYKKSAMIMELSQKYDVPTLQQCKYIWMSPDGKTHSQIGHILIDKRRHSSVLDVRSFRVADCDTDHYLVVGKVMERLVVKKQRSQSQEAK
jgi:hypothetical protein